MANTSTDTSTNLTTHKVPTSHGTIHVVSTASGSPDLPALLLLHGNSSSSRIFTPILTTPSAHKILAFDLPGHGSSSDAPDPSRTYTQRGYAEAAVEVLDALGVQSVIVLGNSLGGHNAIELIPLLEPAGRIRGIMIVGTPPALGASQVSQGFHAKDPYGTVADAHMHLAAEERWSDSDISTFPYEAYGPPGEAWMEEAARRTDGRARRIMFEAFRERRGVDQVRVVAESSVPVAVVNGAREPFINLDYIDKLEFRNLWEGKCHRLEGLGHAPFWERPDVFQPVWERFVKDCSGGK